MSCMPQNAGESVATVIAAMDSRDFIDFGRGIAFNFEHRRRLMLCVDFDQSGLGGL